jgi:hypothetical protein
MTNYSVRTAVLVILFLGVTLGWSAVVVLLLAVAAGSLVLAPVFVWPGRSWISRAGESSTLCEGDERADAAVPNETPLGTLSTGGITAIGYWLAALTVMILLWIFL